MIECEFGCQEDYKDDLNVMNQLLSLVIDDIAECSRVGCLMPSGKHLHLIPLGCKGDWSFLVHDAAS